MKILEINKLGKDLKVKVLSVGDMLKLNSIAQEDETTQLLKIVELAIIEPKMTFEEIYNIEPKYINDLTEIVSIATGTSDEQ